MKVMWVGFRITEKQYQQLKRTTKDGVVRISPEGWQHTELLGRKFKFNDIISGGITEDDEDETFSIIRFERG